MPLCDDEAEAVAYWLKVVQSRTIITETGCWEWQGALAGGFGGGGRYGSFGKNKRRWYAHRVALMHKTVDEIRRLLQAGEAGISIAKRFGVSRTTISQIKNRRRRTSSASRPYPTLSLPNHSQHNGRNPATAAQ